MGLFFSNANLPVPAIPTIGVGLYWVYAGSTTVMLYSNHPSGSAFIPCFNTSTGQATIVEIKSSQLPMSVNLGSSGANGLDTGSVAANKFYCIRMIAKADGGSPALLATLNAGTPTIPAAYSGGIQSDILWGVSCSVDYDSSGSTDEISNFIQSAPGVCRYLSGGGGFPGDGVQALSGGTATTSTAVDLSHLVPSPIAMTRQESLGSAMIYAYAANTDVDAADTRHAYIYYSADGRTMDDATVIDGVTYNDDGLERLHRFGRLDNATAQGHRDECVSLDFPLACMQTTTAQGFKSNSTGTLANILQYRWTGTASATSMDIYIKGWRLNG
jgi:hypothetical protein